MKTKWPLYLGIILLTVGIVLNKITNWQPIPLVILLMGVAFKVSYIVYKYRMGEYKPGGEVYLLMIGLILFLTGLYFKSHPVELHHAFLMAPGIVFKMGFILIFIFKTRRVQTTFKETISN